MRISLFGLLSLRQGPAAGLVYRLRRWPELPASLRTLEVLRMLSAMGHRPVSRHWILRNSKLKPAVLDELLELLAKRGDVEVVDASRYRPESA